MSCVAIEDRDALTAKLNAEEEKSRLECAHVLQRLHDERLEHQTDLCKMKQKGAEEKAAYLSDASSDPAAAALLQETCAEKAALETELMDVKIQKQKMERELNTLRSALDTPSPVVVSSNPDSSSNMTSNMGESEMLALEQKYKSLETEHASLKQERESLKRENYTLKVPCGVAFRLSTSI